MCILAYKSSIVFANNSPLCLLQHLHELSLTKESLWSIEINFFSHIYILALHSGSLVACLCIWRGRACVCVWEIERESEVILILIFLTLLMTASYCSVKAAPGSPLWKPLSFSEEVAVGEEESEELGVSSKVLENNRETTDGSSKQWNKKSSKHSAISSDLSDMYMLLPICYCTNWLLIGVQPLQSTLVRTA